jgi:hypothetical protein
MMMVYEYTDVSIIHHPPEFKTSLFGEGMNSQFQVRYFGDWILFPKLHVLIKRQE